MAHKLIVGTTLSGKSTLARAVVADAVRRGLLCVIYDPLESPEWGTPHVYSDASLFFDAIRRGFEAGLPMFVVVDEADTLLTMGDRQNWWLFTRGRHYGIEACAITQRPQMIAPTVRGMCGEVYVFNVSKSDAAMLSQDFAAEGLEQAPLLAQGEFLRAIWKDRKKVVDKLRIF